MLIQLFKPLLAAAGSAIMLALLTLIQPIDAGQERTIKADDVDGKSLTIKYQEDEFPTYIVDGKKYHWQNLSQHQQHRLTQLEKALKASEKLLEKMAQTMEPASIELEIQARKMAQAAEALAATHESYDVHSLPELIERQRNIELQDKEALVAQIEKQVQVHEKHLRKLELKLEKHSSHFENKINNYLEQVINVLELN
ncbi:hypothetical protein [Pleionea sediminis]|uniref:hypothetical protein n=1 Tax=Pleionea sediminis TaxID=2569479 RepID=UPI001185A28F|nr:hypothetical protein [Pleionea sediminis]